MEPSSIVFLNFILHATGNTITNFIKIQKKLALTISFGYEFPVIVAGFIHSYRTD